MAEELLKSANLDYEILNNMADYVRIFNKNREVVFVNKQMGQTTGVDSKKKICNFEECPINNKVLNSVFESGAVLEREERVNGEYYSVKASPIKEETGNIIGIIEVFRNINLERKIISDIIGKNKDMTVEMNHAKKIQQALLPDRGFYDNLQIDYIYKPATTLSGDMFDIFNIDSENIGIYIADVVGHGFASSMVTMFVRLLMRNLSFEILLKPSLTLEELWKRFNVLNLDIEVYFTCFYGVYNKKLGKLIYSNAGHFPAPVLLGEGVSYLETAGFPISRIVENVDYIDYSVDLNVGDRLLFMTDGIVEASNIEGKTFGIDRIVQIILNEENDALNDLKNKVEEFIWKEQRDDMTALLLKVW